MALVKCKECEKEISSEASQCPNCGIKIVSFVEKIQKIENGIAGGFEKVFKAAFWIIVIVVVIAYLG